MAASTLDPPRDACWRLSDSFSNCEVDGADPGRPEFAEDPTFLNWGKTPPAASSCHWMPHGKPAFDHAIRIPEGLELRLKYDGKQFVARTSVSSPQAGSGLVNPVIYWEILEVNSGLGLLSPRVPPTPGPSQGPAFKALLSNLGKADSAYRRLKIRQFLGFHDVLVLGHIDHAFRGGHGSWTMPTPFLLDQGKPLSATDRLRLSYVRQDVRRHLQLLIHLADENSPPGLHNARTAGFANGAVLQQLLMGREKNVLQSWDMNAPRAAAANSSRAAAGEGYGLGIKRPVPMCERMLKGCPAWQNYIQEPTFVHNLHQDPPAPGPQQWARRLQLIGSSRVLRLRLQLRGYRQQAACPSRQRGENFRRTCQLLDQDSART